MKSRCFMGLVLAAPLILGGCLLPQPDTPPVPPFARSGSKTAVGTAPVLPQPDTPPITPLKPNTPATGASSGAGGNLLPQPDTPPIQGISTGAAIGNAGTASAAAPANADHSPSLPVSNGSGLAPNAGASSLPTATHVEEAPGTLAGSFTGASVSQLDVTDESGATTFQTTAVGTDGSFTFKLLPGRYKLVVTLKGRKLRVGNVFVVDSNVARSYSIKLRETPPGATVSEDVTLADPAATGS